MYWSATGYIPFVFYKRYFRNEANLNIMKNTSLSAPEIFPCIANLRISKSIKFLHSTYFSVQKLKTNLYV